MIVVTNLPVYFVGMRYGLWHKLHQCWAESFNKGAHSLIRKTGEWPQTLPAFSKWWGAWRSFQGTYTPDTFLVTSPDILLKLSIFSNIYDHNLSCNCKLGELINQSHSIRELGLQELAIALLLLWTFHFISTATCPKESVPTSSIINVCTTIV